VKPQDDAIRRRLAPGSKPSVTARQMMSLSAPHMCIYGPSADWMRERDESNCGRQQCDHTIKHLVLPVQPRERRASVVAIKCAGRTLDACEASHGRLWIQRRRLACACLVRKILAHSQAKMFSAYRAMLQHAVGGLTFYVHYRVVSFHTPCVRRYCRYL
jgi:hypothetical protein